MKSERILYSFLLVLIFSVILTNIKSKMAFTYLNNIEEENRFWVVKTHIQKNFDIVLLGDSRVYRGISPFTMEQILTGFRIFNFGYSSGGLNKYMYEEANKKIDQNSCVKSIVFGISPNSLTSSTAQNSQ
jgi:hypothetical protein